MNDFYHRLLREVQHYQPDVGTLRFNRDLSWALAYFHDGRVVELRLTPDPYDRGEAWRKARQVVARIADLEKAEVTWLAEVLS